VLPGSIADIISVIEGEAPDRAVVLACVYVGRLQMAHIAPKASDADARGRQAELVFNALVAGGVLPPSAEAVVERAEL